MHTNTRNGLIVLVIAIAVVLLFIGANSTQAPSPAGQSQTATTTDIGDTTSDGTITFARPADFVLALNEQQVLVRSYIPPCNEGFNYCLYYKGTDYAGSNFESAGLRIQKRTDLSTERTCLTTPPSGFDSGMTPTKQKSENAYSSSVFGNVGDAGAGHMASGSLYRLYVRSNSKCYEFETRVGQTQFANYPEGSIKEFTQANQAALHAKLVSILQNVSISSGEKNLFPQI